MGETATQSRQGLMIAATALRRDVDGFLSGQLAALAWRADITDLAVPAVTKVDHPPLIGLLGQRFLVNVGDPFDDDPSHGGGHAGVDTKVWERRVVTVVADLLRVPPRRRWGYVTSGVGESNLAALRLARARHRNAVVYFSRAAHTSVAGAVDLLAMDSVVIDTDPVGEMDYQDLAARLAPNRHRPAVVVATTGTWSGAVDDVRRIGLVLDTLAVRRRYIHADATGLGLALALVDAHQRAGFDVADGASSVAVGVNMLLGCPFPCGVLVVKTPRHRGAITPAATTSARRGAGETVFESRSGQGPLVLWHGLVRHGIDGLRQRAEAAWALAAYAQQRLAGIGWQSFHCHPHSFTVVLKTPPVAVTHRWGLPDVDGCSRILCLHGIRREQIDEFLKHLVAATR